jgi:Cu(I)/Ag(I) efflux system periplasmic protein CusF
MRRFAAVVAAVAMLSAAVPTIAQPAVRGSAYKASGTVTKIDPAAGRVTIAHGPVQALKWPAMSMTFGVKDKALLGRAQPGKKVEFEFEKQGSDYVITRID